MKANYTILTLMLSFVFLLGATALSYGQTTTIANHNFDAGLDSWVSGGPFVTLDAESNLNNLYSAGNFDYTSCGNFSGNVIVLRGNGNNNNNNDQKILTSPSYDMAGYDSVIFDYDYFVSSMDSNDEGWNLDYSNDNGSSWVTVKTYRRGPQFGNLYCGPNDTGRKELVILDNATYSFTNQSKFRMYTERDGNGNTGGADYLIIDNVTLTGNITSTCSATGSILMERYDGISGTSITDLTGSANYPNNPSSSTQLTSFEIPANVAENYGARVSGYICAPETGYYTFWMTSDDNGELNLSTDEDPANKTTIAYVTAWTPQNVWDDESNQKSNPVLLIAGNSYYVEALMKEGGGGDHLAIGWAKPGEATTAPSQIIPGSVLSPAVSTAPVALFFEDFEDESDNDTNGTDAYGTNWDTNEQSSNPDDFKVKDNEFKSKKTQGEAILFTETINISNYTDLKLSSFIEFRANGNMEDSDFIKFQYKLNGGALVDVPNATYFNDNYSDTTYEWPLTGITGTTLEIYITFKTNSGDEEHRIDNIKLTGVIDCDGVTNTVTNANATAGDTQATLSWLNPNATCVTIDEVMVVAKANSAVTTAPTGNGSAYTANATFGSGTTFDGGYVVYKDTEEALTITGLTNGTTYHLTTFTREGTTWSTGVTVTVTATAPPVALFFETFNENDNAITGNGDGFNSTNNIPWDLTNDNASVDGDYKFEVDGGNDELDVQLIDGLASWQTTDYINIEGFTNLQFSFMFDKFDIDSNEADTDYVEAFYQLNGETEPVSIQKLFRGSQEDFQYTTSLQNIPDTATSIKLIIKFNHTNSNSEHEVAEIKLTGVPYANVWTGDEGDLITTTENWTAGVVPGENDVIMIGSGKHLKILDDLTFKTVVVNAGAFLTIDKRGSITTVEDFIVKVGGIVNMMSELGNGNGNPQGNTDAAAADKFSSLIVGGTATGDINYNRAARPDRKSDGTVLRSYVSSPVVGEVFDGEFLLQNPDITASTNGVNHIFVSWNAIIGNWSWLTNNTELVSGKGYMVGMGNNTGNNGNNNQFNLKFTGEIENNDVDIAVNGTGTTEFNILGNPYPAFLDMNAFLDHNMSIGILHDSTSVKSGLYAWTGNGNSNQEKYKAYNKSNAKLLRPGQGFSVAVSGTGNVEFKKAWMRIPNDASEIDLTFSGRGVNSTPAVNDYIKVSLSASNLYPMETEIYFNDFGSNGLDVGYDTEVYGGQAASNFGIYTHLVEGNTNKDIAIQTLDHSNLLTHIVPLGINATAGTTLTISLSDTLLPDNTTVYLEDRLANTWTVLSDADYTFTAATNLTTSGRFYIHFEDNSQTLSNTEFDLNNLKITSITGAKAIVINGQLDADSVLEIYDINGRKVMTKVLDSYKTTNRVDVSQLTTAAYIVRVQNTTQQVAQQVIIN